MEGTQPSLGGFISPGAFSMRPGLWRIPGPQTWQPAEGERQGAGVLFASLKHSSWRGCSYIAGSSRGPLAGSAQAEAWRARGQVKQAEREQTGHPVICMAQMGANHLPAPMLLIRAVRGPQTARVPSEERCSQQPRSYPQQSAWDPRTDAGAGLACPARWASSK